MLIGLCGKPQSGKSEVRCILERSGFEVVNVKIGLATACSALTGVPVENFLTQKGKASLFKGVPLRNLLGQVGNTMEELFGDYHTIETAIKSYEPIEGKNLVVDSIRKTQAQNFPGTLIEIVSNRGIETGNEFDEYDQGKIDYVVYNNGTLGDLEKQVKDILDQMGYNQ